MGEKWIAEEHPGPDDTVMIVLRAESPTASELVALADAALPRGGAD